MTLFRFSMVLSFFLASQSAISAPTAVEKMLAVQQAQIRSLIEENKKTRAEVEKLKAASAGLQVWKFSHGWVYAQYPTESQSPYAKLPFSINGGHQGGAFFLMCSNNSNDGNSTTASIYLVRAGFNGNYYSLELVKGSPVIYSHRVRTDGYIEVQTYGGNSTCTILGNDG